ncbi:MAG: hypothetical protein MZV65_19885 [Chromatiales bacterium]|nr:hypothetical protein [Chromatiales bacterium]
MAEARPACARRSGGNLGDAGAGFCCGMARCREAPDCTCWSCPASSSRRTHRLKRAGGDGAQHQPGPPGPLRARLDDYSAAKAPDLPAATASMVVNADDPAVDARCVEPGRDVLRFSSRTSPATATWPRVGRRSRPGWRGRDELLRSLRRTAAQRRAQRSPTRLAALRHAAARSGCRREAMLRRRYAQFTGLPHRIALVRRARRRALVRRFEGHQRRRDGRGGARPAGPGGADRRRRRQGPGFRAAAGGVGAARRGAWC